MIPCFSLISGLLTYIYLFHIIFLLMNAFQKKTFCACKGIVRNNKNCCRFNDTVIQWKHFYKPVIWSEDVEPSFFGENCWTHVSSWERASNINTIQIFSYRPASTHNFLLFFNFLFHQIWTQNLVWILLYGKQNFIGRLRLIYFLTISLEANNTKSTPNLWQRQKILKRVKSLPNKSKTYGHPPKFEWKCRANFLKLETYGKCALLSVSEQVCNQLLFLRKCNEMFRDTKSAITSLNLEQAKLWACTSNS